MDSDYMTCPWKTRGIPPPKKMISNETKYTNSQMQNQLPKEKKWKIVNGENAQKIPKDM